jgi:hypothetical protein
MCDKPSTTTECSATDRPTTGPKARVGEPTLGRVKLIVFYIAFVIAGGFVDYFLGLFVEYERGLKREPNRLPTPLFLFSLGFLAACSVADHTKRRHTSVLVGSRWPLFSSLFLAAPAHWRLWRRYDASVRTGISGVLMVMTRCLARHELLSLLGGAAAACDGAQGIQQRWRS